ncbi:YdcF family protein [Loktanella salsilacus]|uniref:YdcF family protein n=1 Tax=Loktanella salsilacus TaxID=195913 RepID=UPI0037362B1E
MDAIIILGAAVWPTGPSPTLRRRVAHGARLWHRGAAPMIVVCGGLGLHAPSEAAAMAALLIELGVPKDAIVQEDRSTTTYENIAMALPLLRQVEARHVLIVTDMTHAPRAALVARHFGLHPRVSTPSIKGGRKRTILRQLVRELAAYPLYAIRLKIQKSGRLD